MPCLSYDTHEGPSNDDKLNEVTAMLCKTMQIIEDNYPNATLINEDKQLMKWWKQHKKQDAARKKLELKLKQDAEKKQRARAKLTDEEAKALGIK
jgi:hypothetical protein